MISTLLKNQGTFTVLCRSWIPLHCESCAVGYPLKICILAVLFWRIFFTSSRENRKWEWVSWALVEPLIWEVRAWLCNDWLIRKPDQVTMMSELMSFITMVCFASRVALFQQHVFTFLEWLKYVLTHVFGVKWIHLGCKSKEKNILHHMTT